MFPVYIKSGVRFKLVNTVYQILKCLPALRVEAQDENFKDTKIFTQRELISYLNKGLLVFESKGRNSLKDNSSSMNTSFKFEDIESLKHKDKAIFRFEVIRPLLQIPYTHRKSTDIETRVNEVNSWANNPKLAQDNLGGCKYYRKISMASVYRWLHNFEESSGDFHSLIPEYHCSGGKDKPRIAQAVLDYIRAAIKEIYLNNKRVSIEELKSEVLMKIAEFNKYSEEKLTCPPLSTFARYVAKIPEYELVAKRIGKRTAGRKFDLVGAGVTASYPLERVEIDHTPVDVILINEKGEPMGRPYLILAIDKYTRHVLGFSIGMSNGVGWPEVMQCIKHIMTDKSYIKEMYPFIENEWNAFGIPKTVVVDNGLEFKNNSMKDACYQIGFVLEFCPPRVPQWKGSIERFFGTANTGLFHNLPGTTRSNPKELGDDENPCKNARLTFSVFLALVYKWIVDVYSQDLNRGAGGIPSKIWEKALEDHPVAWPSNISETAILLGRTTYRQISRRGIELDSLRYNSLDLNKLYLQFSKENKGMGLDFKVKYDPQNLGELYVYDHLIGKEWICVPCINPDYAQNLSEWEHKEAKTYARREFQKVDEEALARAKLCIRKLIESGIGYTEKQIARANGVNSNNEISKYIGSIVTDNSYPVNESHALDVEPSNSTVSTISVSDIGCTLPDTEIIIPQSLMASSGDGGKNKVIDITGRKESPTKAKKDSSGKRSGTPTKDGAFHGSDMNIDFSDFSGFGVVSTFSEEKNDG